MTLLSLFLRIDSQGLPHFSPLGLLLEPIYRNIGYLSILINALAVLGGFFLLYKIALNFITTTDKEGTLFIKGSFVFLLLLTPYLWFMIIHGHYECLFILTTPLLLFYLLKNGPSLTVFLLFFATLFLKEEAGLFLAALLFSFIFLLPEHIQASSLSLKSLQKTCFFLCLVGICYTVMANHFVYGASFPILSAQFSNMAIMPSLLNTNQDPEILIKNIPVLSQALSKLILENSFMSLNDTTVWLHFGKFWYGAFTNLPGILCGFLSGTISSVTKSNSYLFILPGFYLGAIFGLNKLTLWIEKKSQHSKFIFLILFIALISYLIYNFSNIYQSFLSL